MSFWGVFEHPDYRRFFSLTPNLLEAHLVQSEQAALVEERDFHTSTVLYAFLCLFMLNLWHRHNILFKDGLIITSILLLAHYITYWSILLSVIISRFSCLPAIWIVFKGKMFFTPCVSLRWFNPCYVHNISNKHSIYHSDIHKIIVCWLFNSKNHTIIYIGSVPRKPTKSRKPCALHCV